MGIGYVLLNVGMILGAYMLGVEQIEEYEGDLSWNLWKLSKKDAV